MGKSKKFKPFDWLLHDSLNSYTTENPSLKKFQHPRVQSRTQSPQALWTAVGRQERLWGTINQSITLYLSMVENNQPLEFCYCRISGVKQCKLLHLQPIKKNSFFQILQSLSWQPTTGQRAWGLWVQDRHDIYRPANSNGLTVRLTVWDINSRSQGLASKSRGE